jgi:DNA repair exonuclease SbcCD ATPase subunit
MGDPQEFTVDIENFQSLGRARATFSPGINALVGENNIGKTALFRAVATALFNRSADGLIKNGEPGAKVHVTFRGHDMVWERSRKAAGGESKVTYVVDGSKFTKTKGNVIPEVEEAFNIREKRVFNQSRPLALNFWNQEALPFLMNASPAQIFEFLSLSSEEGNLTDVVRDLRKEQDALASEVRGLEGEVNAYTQTVVRETAYLEHYTGFSEVHAHVMGMEAAVARVDRLASLVEIFQTFSTRQQVLSAQVSALDYLHGQVQTSFSTAASAAQQQEKLSVLVQQGVVAQSQCVQLSGDIASLQPALAIPLSHMADTFQQVQQQEPKMRRLHDAVTYLQRGEQTVLSLRQLIDRLQAVQRTVDVQDIPHVLSQTQSVLSVITSLSSLQQSVCREQATVDQLDQERERVEQELLSFSACPLCHQSLKGDVFHD